MKKLLISLITIISLFSIDAMAWGNISADVRLERYASSSTKGEVVFIGNSITDFWVRDHASWFTDNNYCGRGISGQTSSLMLLRFRQDVINLHPRVVVINAGINDICENTGEYIPALTFDNIVSMAQIAKASGIKVILTSVLPCDKCKWKASVTDIAKKIDALNDMIQAYSKKNKIPYINYNTPMRTATGAMQDALSNDGLHPNMAGYTLMESIAKPIITKALKSK